MTTLRGGGQNNPSGGARPGMDEPIVYDGVSADIQSDATVPSLASHARGRRIVVGEVWP